MRIRRTTGISSGDVTPRALFDERRRLLRAGTVALATLALPGHARAGQPLGPLIRGRYSDAGPPTRLEDVTSYNNFYEFGTSKQDPSVQAHKLPLRPWAVSIEGLVRTPRVIDIERLLKLAPLLVTRVLPALKT